MIDPLLARTIAFGCAALLLFAAWHKISTQREFVAALGEYRLLPQLLLRPTGVVLPAAEAALGLGWLTGFAPQVVALLSAALLGVYAVAMAINLWRGRVHISCGCGFGGASGEDQPLSWWLVARNLVLAAVAASAALPTGNRELGRIDWLMVVLALLACTALYCAASQLLRNDAAIAIWRTPRG